MDATARSTRPGRATLRRIDPLLGPGSAVLLGIALGFFLLAMPAPVRGSLVAALGLPPAAAGSPVALALLVALLAGVATWAGFRLFDRPRRTPAKPPVPARAATAPVLRRTDAHPDAPARRPIFAASDLGTPLDLIDPLPPEEGVAPPTPFPAASSAPVIDPGRAEKTSDPPSSAADPALAYPTVSVAPATAVAHGDPPPSLAGMVDRLEVGLARKALALGEGDDNVTPLQREIAPFRGDMRAALDEIHGHTAGGP